MPRNDPSSDTVTRSKSNSKGVNPSTVVKLPLPSTVQSSSSSSATIPPPSSRSSSRRTKDPKDTIDNDPSHRTDEKDNNAGSSEFVSSSSRGDGKRQSISNITHRKPQQVQESHPLSHTKPKNDTKEEDPDDEEEEDDDDDAEGEEEDDDDDEDEDDDDEEDNDNDDDDDDQKLSSSALLLNRNKSTTSSSKSKKSTLSSNPSSSSTRRTISATNTGSQGKGSSSSGSVLTTVVPKKVDAPAFLRKTFNLVNDPSVEQVITWSTDGTRIVICNVSAMETVILPKFFKHSNFSSFVRQLNMYGFSKVSTKGSLQNYLSSAIITKLTNNNIPLNNVRIFYHPLFQRYQPELLAQIKRKGAIATQGNNDDDNDNNTDGREGGGGRGGGGNEGGGDDTGSVMGDNNGTYGNHGTTVHSSHHHHHHHHHQQHHDEPSSRHPAASSSSSSSSSLSVTTEMWHSMNKRLQQLEQQALSTNQAIEDMQHYMQTFQYSYDRVIMGLYIALQGSNIQCSIGIHPLTHIIILRFQSLENKYIMNETTINNTTVPNNSNSPRLLNTSTDTITTTKVTSSSPTVPTTAGDNNYINRSTSTVMAATHQVPLDFEHVLLYHEFYNLCLNQHPMLFSGTNNIIRNIFEQYQQSLVTNMATTRSNTTINNNNNGNNSFITLSASLCIDVPLTTEPVPRSLLHEAFPSGHLLEYLTNSSSTVDPSASTSSSSHSHQHQAQHILESSPLTALIASIENQQPYPTFMSTPSVTHVFSPPNASNNGSTIHIKTNTNVTNNNHRNYIPQRSIEYLPYDNGNHPSHSNDVSSSSSLPPIRVPGRNPYTTDNHDNHQHQHQQQGYTEATTSSYNDNNLYPHSSKRTRSTVVGYDRYSTGNNATTNQHNSSKRSRNNNIPLESPRPPELYSTNSSSVHNGYPSSHESTGMMNSLPTNHTVPALPMVDYSNNNSSAPMRLDSFYSTTPSFAGVGTSTIRNNAPIEMSFTNTINNNHNGIDVSRNNSSSSSGVGRLYSFNSFTLDGNDPASSTTINGNSSTGNTTLMDHQPSHHHSHQHNNPSLSSLSPGATTTTIMHNNGGMGPSTSSIYPTLHPQTSFLPGLRRASTLSGTSNVINGMEDTMSPFPSSSNGTTISMHPPNHNNNTLSNNNTYISSSSTTNNGGSTSPSGLSNDLSFFSPGILPNVSSVTPTPTHASSM